MVVDVEAVPLLEEALAEEAEVVVDLCAGDGRELRDGLDDPAEADQQRMGDLPVLLERGRFVVELEHLREGDERMEAVTAEDGFLDMVIAEPEPPFQVLLLVGLTDGVADGVETRRTALERLERLL